MTKKVKISFLILVWSIVILQLFVNYKDREKTAIEAMAGIENAQTILEE